MLANRPLTPAAAQTFDANPALPVATGILLIYIFLRFSMFHELLGFRLGITLSYNYVFGPLIVLMVLISGNLLNTIKTKPGFCLTAFCVAIFFSIPFSYWSGGSWMIAQAYITSSMPVFWAVVTFVQTPAQVKKFAVTIVIASAVLLFFRPALEAGDARMAFESGSLSNPNDLAIHLLLLLPFCVLVIRQSKWTSPLLWISVAIALALLLVTLQTGSRGGLLTLVGMLGLVFLRIKNLYKLPVALVAMFAAMLFFVTLPEAARVRYLSMFSSEVEVSEEAGRQAEFAAASSEARKELFIRSLIQTARHPIFGVGAGQFQVAEVEEAKKEGKRPAWAQSHNAYTQVSSEIGVPGLIFYLAAIITSIGMLRRIRKGAASRPDLAMLSQMADAVLLCWVGYCVNTVFNHLGYRMYMPTLVGLSVALYVMYERQLRSRINPTAPSLPFSRGVAVQPVLPSIRFQRR